jgi:hypothetical protein
VAFQRFAFQTNFQQLEEDAPLGMGVVLFPPMPLTFGRRKKDKTLYALAIVARDMAGMSYSRGPRVYKPRVTGLEYEFAL